MLIGQVYRYSSETDKKDPSIEFVDGLPNYFFHTYDAKSTRQVVFQRGIHGISEEIGIDKIKRRPAIIISSSPHKAGTAQTPWHYVETQQDIDFILEQTSSFHDSVLKELNYISGAYVDETNSMHCSDSERRVIIHLDSQWCRPVEMIF